jgi:hypothetical protein
MTPLSKIRTMGLFENTANDGINYAYPLRHFVVKDPSDYGVKHIQW